MAAYSRSASRGGADDHGYAAGATKEVRTPHSPSCQQKPDGTWSVGRMLATTRITCRTRRVRRCPFCKVEAGSLLTTAFLCPCWVSMRLPKPARPSGRAD